MTPKPRKDDALTEIVHLRLSARDRAAIEAWAKEECRSPANLVLYIVRKAIADHEDEVSPLADQKAARITHATRAGLQSTKSVA